MRKSKRKDYRKLYKDLVKNKKLTQAHVVQYSIIRAVKESRKLGTQTPETLARTYLAKAFTPVRNKTKLLNGRKPYDMKHLKSCSDWNTITRPLDQPIASVLTNQEEMTYLDVLNKIRPEDLSREYVYVFVRQDLYPEYQLVQAAHVTMQLGNNMGRGAADGVYFSCIGVKDLVELRDVMHHLSQLGKRYEIFLEPDMEDPNIFGNVMTAVATYPIKIRDREPLFRYSRLRFNAV